MIFSNKVKLRNSFLYIFMSNILVILLLSSCSKDEKKVKIFELNKNIEFNLDNKNKENSKDGLDKLIYKFSDKKNKIIYNVKSLQLFTSKFSQVLFTISFDINLKKIKEDQANKKKIKLKKLPLKNDLKENKFSYKIYFTNLKIEHKVYYGRIDFGNIQKKYNLLLNAIYFNLSIDKYGKKSFFLEKKVSLNKKFKSMAGFIFNILNNIFIELPDKVLENKSFTISDKKYELTSDFEEDGSLMLKENITKKIINTESYKDYVVFKASSKKNKLRILYSNTQKLPEKINILFEDKDKLEFENEEYSYSIKNYYFIERLLNQEGE